MDRFEFVFSLIGLLLGLSLVEVLSGLAKTLKSRSSIRVGWLTPMLGVWVILHVTSFWGVTWSLREILPALWPTLGAGMAFSAAYYLAASSVFPDNPADFGELDSYYERHKREVVGIIFGCTLAVQLAGVLLGRTWTPLVAAINLSMFAGMGVTFLVSSRRLNILALGFMITVMVINFLIP